MDDVVLRLILRDEFKATLESYKKQLGAAQQESRQAGAQMSGAFAAAKTGAAGLGRELLAMAGWVGVGATIATTVRTIVTATAEAETEAVKLATALARTGEAADIPRVNAWAEALLQATGQSDELSVSLVALGSTMQLDTALSREYIQIAADMAVTTGTVGGNFEALARAAVTGGRSVQQLARQFGIIVTDGTPAAEIIERIKKATDGAAAAQLNTLAGQWKLLRENIGNASEWGAVGNAIRGVLTAINEATAQRQRNQMTVAEMGIEQLQAEKKALLELFSAGKGSDYAGERLRQIGAALRELREETSKATVNSAGGVAGFIGPIPDEEEIKAYAAGVAKAAEETKRLAAANAEAAEATRYANAQQAIEDNTQALRDQWAVSKLITIEEARQLALEQQRAMLDTAYDDVGNDTTEAATKRQRAALEADAEEFFGDIDLLIASGKEQTALAITLDNIKMQWSDDERDRAAAVHQAALDNAAEWNDLFTTQIGNTLITAIEGGDIGGAIKAGMTQLLSKAFQQSGSSAASSNIWASLVVAVVSLIDDSMAAATTKGGQARELLTEKLQEVFDFEIDTGTSTRKLKLKTALTDLELDATGRADFWNDIAKVITGFSGGGQANIIAAQFEDLNLTTGQTIDALGNLIAQANDLTEAEGDQLAAQAALLSLTTFTRDELATYAQAYGDATNLIERRSELEEQILEQAQAYADATGSAKDKALDDLEASRSEYVALLVAEAEAARRSDEELVAAIMEEQGKSKEEAQSIVDGLKDSETVAQDSLTVLKEIRDAVAGSSGTGWTHHSGHFPDSGATGEHFARVLNSELIARPDQFQQAAEYLASRGYTSGGGSSRTIILQLNGRTISEVLDEENYLSRRVA